MSRTSIGWTAVQDSRGRWHGGYTYNPWQGCMKKTAECARCFAAALDMRFSGGEHWGPEAPRKRASGEYLAEPHEWNRRAARLGVRLRVFCGSMMDWLEDRPGLEAWRAELLELIDQTPNLDWLLLTKRPENLLRLTPWRGMAPGNVWLGISAGNQAFLDERWPLITQLGAVVYFVSAEPLIGPLSTRDYPVSWLIVGSERGPGARRPEDAWLDAVVGKCRQTGVPLFLKQWQLPTARPGVVEDMPSWRGRQWIEQPAAAGWQPLATVYRRRCSAQKCEREVSSKLFMCGSHWRMVPRRLQLAVWQHYRPGQEQDGKVTAKWLEAAQAAIQAVAQREAELAGVQLTLPLGGP
jgi:protein gp37